MKYKKILMTYLGTIIILSIIFFGNIYIQDPLKIFHKPWIHQEYLQTNMREQAAGIINNWEFDSIILGTSMLENTSSKEASDTLGGNFINISVAGSTFHERKFILDYVLKRKHIKTVIYTLDTLGSLGSLIQTDEKKIHKSYQTSNWDYLYDDNVLNDFKIYINNHYLKCIFLFDNTKQCIGEKVNFDRPNAWYQSIFHFYRFGGIDNWFKVKKHWQVIGTVKNIVKSIDAIKSGKIIYDKQIEDKIKQSQTYIKKTLQSSLEEHPETKFILIVPPYSRLEYACWAQYEKSTFEIYKRTLKYIVKLQEKYNNIRVYAWGKETFLDNLANYQDLSHYEYKINSWELKAIKEDKGHLSSHTIDDYLKYITQRALQYNVLKYEEKFRKFLEN